MDKEMKIKQLTDQINYFKQFMHLSRKQQLEVIRELEKSVIDLLKQKD